MIFIISSLTIGSSCNNQSNSSNSVPPMNSRKITRDGMTIFLPNEWKLAVEDIGMGIKLYTAENKNWGMITFYKLNNGLVETDDEFVKSTSKEMINNIQNGTTSLVLSRGIKNATRQIKNKTLRGKKERLRISELMPPRSKYNLDVEYYQVELGEKIVRIILMGKSDSSDMSDIELIMNSFEI